MKLFYITTPEIAKSLFTGWHAKDIGNGKILMCAIFNDEYDEKNWAETEGVIPLPHPIFEASTRLSEEHLKHLSGKYQLEPGHTIHDLIKQAAKEDLWMRLHVL
jgi:hypothetical protein